MRASHYFSGHAEDASFFAVSERYFNAVEGSDDNDITYLIVELSTRLNFAGYCITKYDENDTNFYVQVHHIASHAENVRRMRELGILHFSSENISEYIDKQTDFLIKCNFYVYSLYENLHRIIKLAEYLCPESKKFSPKGILRIRNALIVHAEGGEPGRGRVLQPSLRIRSRSLGGPIVKNLRTKDNEAVFQDPGLNFNLDEFEFFWKRLVSTIMGNEWKRPTVHRSGN